MTKTMKLRKIGTSLGFTVPKDVLRELDLEEGDTLFLVRTANGVELTRYDPDFEEVLEVSRGVMRRYPNALKKLAEG
jgi:putative addiction module antidote